MTENDDRVMTDNDDDVLARLELTQDSDWSIGPVVGDEARALLERLRGVPDDERRTLLHEAHTVLSRCADPVQDERRVGIVVGHVQSGKTLNFMMLSALARDNRVPLVIVLAGSARNLQSQTRQRFDERDGLDLQYRSDRQWHHVRFDLNDANIVRTLRTELSDWHDEGLPDDERKTLLITVMKHHRHLEELANALEQVRAELRGLHAIVIDDEGDQISLNSRLNDDDESANYREIGRLRARLPGHTYVQYTATPQAPLLIGLVDHLSPKFVKVLTPGAAYVGGAEFFSGEDDYLRVIPSDECFSPDDYPQEPPATLRTALAQFFVGTTSEYIRGARKNGENRSMMIHPDRRTDPHARYDSWVHQLRDDWMALLEDGAGAEGVAAAVHDLFRQAYDDLAQTADLEPFDRVMQELHRVMRLTHITTVNAAEGQTPTIDWQQVFSNILIGGQALDRGYTVEGLTVSYMPRPVGVGNADTVQQRARFFGYKRSYLGLCRIWLPVEVRDAFIGYVRHENLMRQDLRAVEQAGKSLADWKREFLLDPALRPTRASVVGLPVGRGSINGWWQQRRPHVNPAAAGENRDHILRFLDSVEMEEWEDAYSSDADGHQHRTCRIPLTSAVEFLSGLRITEGIEADAFYGLLIFARAWLEEFSEEELSATIVQMGTGLDRARFRSLGDTGRVSQLMGGESPRGKDVYPGDRAIKAAHELTIQIHHLDVGGSPDNPEYRDIYALAFHVPENLTSAWWRER